MASPGMGRGLDAVYRAKHLSVGEQHVEAVQTVELTRGPSAVLCLDHPEAFVVQHRCRRKAGEELILCKRHSCCWQPTSVLTDVFKLFKTKKLI